MQALPNEIIGRFFIGDLIKWLKANLKSPVRLVDGEEDVSRRKEQISVFQAPTSWISLCTNEAVQIASKNVARGAIRNVNREWIMGYNRNLGKCSIFDAELWGKLDGLILIQNMSYDGVKILSDNLEVVKAIQILLRQVRTLPSLDVFITCW
ncbi:hypothetical protein PVK06_048267 [Gossypium arboreum]|uniref:RNase H type-1 domain-containing protein n=1 Tax=Gossypium arboreum TaxID=29729 RepID=A0ABR0MFZ8_GOSAR|nr:hypothetical protein PVK06_048267 [Gossypium arboreum]